MPFSAELTGKVTSGDNLLLVVVDSRCMPVPPVGVRRGPASVDFFLDGKRLQLFGPNRHQLYPYAGMAMGARAQRKDAEILRNEFNCNMVRCSHYPQSLLGPDDIKWAGALVDSALPASGDPLYGGLVHPPFLVHLPERIPHPAPELLIQGFAGGSPVARVRMSASPDGDALAMAADDATISADGSDATRVVFRATDAFGNQRRYGDGEVALTLSGPAILVGDNPFAFGQYGGLGAVWVRWLAGRPGTITLTAGHPLLGQAEVQVRSVPVKHVSELA